jgi:hypothetical protein
MSALRYSHGNLGNDIHAERMLSTSGEVKALGLVFQQEP